jgi:5'-nucleotidase
MHSVVLAAVLTRVVLLHFSDYHSHALPFYSEGRPNQGGIARAVTYLRREHRRGALVFSGGDTINKGAPAWSDKYGCAEWPWFNGIVDAMALGNHDPDYGAEAFAKCKASVTYPILSANTEGFQDSAVFTVNGIRVGVFALAGDDFPTLVKTPGFVFSDPLAAARKTVRMLREKADVVVMIGHESLDDDYALARTVPGIDVILGSHSHLKHELTKIEGTDTWFISPFQYLTYISRVELGFDRERKLSRVDGGLVRVDGSIRADAKVAKRVASMEHELEADPQYAKVFLELGKLKSPLPVEALGARTVELMRDVAHADFAISTTSSFRQDLPKGAITFELLRAAMPYENEIVTTTMTTEQVRQLLDFKGDTAYHTPIDLSTNRTIRVATTDFLARVSAYKALFVDVEKSGLHVRDEIRKALTASLFP